MTLDPFRIADADLLDRAASEHNLRPLGKSGLRIPSLAWGMWRLAGETGPARALVEAALDHGLTSNFIRTNAGIASAMAQGALSFDASPGKVSISGAVSAYDGQSGLAVGIGAVSQDGKWPYVSVLSK